MPRTQGCGHGECTTADTPCRYEQTPECAPKLPERTDEERDYPRNEQHPPMAYGWKPGPVGLATSSAPAGGTAEVWLRMNGATQPDGVRWTVNDLDRCEHGRHSADHCFDCPGGLSLGNPFLLCPVPSDDKPDNVRVVDGRVEVRIGTMVRGEPIWVVARSASREASVAEEEADGKLPCSACGHRVRPGRHSLEQCAENQRADAAGVEPTAIDEEQTDGE